MSGSNSLEPAANSILFPHLSYTLDHVYTAWKHAAEDKSCYFCVIYHFSLVLYSLEISFKIGRILEINFLSSAKLLKSEEQTDCGILYPLGSTTYHPQKYHFLFSHFLCFLALDISTPNLNCKQNSNEINGPCYSFRYCGRHRKKQIEEGKAQYAIGTITL